MATSLLSTNRSNPTTATSSSLLWTATFVHEVTHAGQFESGELGFNRQTGEPLAYDTYDEVAAYKAQYAYDPWSVVELKSTTTVNSMSDICNLWVQGIETNGIKIYAPGSNI